MPPRNPSQKLEPGPVVPVVRIAPVQDFTPELLPQILAEINDRQWAAVVGVLLEAKFKAEAMLRNDAIFDSRGRSTYYQGWVAYADYILGSLDTLRSGPAVGSADTLPGERQPGPP